MEPQYAMPKAIGIVIRHRHAVEFIHCSEVVEKLCAMIIVQNNMEISSISILLIGIVLMKIVEIDFMRGEKNAALLHSFLL